jgi:hypothetical protein
VGAVKVNVHFNQFGQIVSVVEVHDGGGDNPPAGVFVSPGLGTLEAKLDGDDPLIVLHAGHTVDIRGAKPKLVRIERPRRGQKA